MNNNNLKTLAALLAFSAVGFANAQSTFTIPSANVNGYTNAEVNDNSTSTSLSVPTVLGPAGANYFVGPNLEITSATISIVAAGSFGSEARFEFYNSAFPGLEMSTGQMFQFNISATSGPVATTFTTTPLTGSLAGAAITSASTYSYNTWDSFPDAIGGVDATVTDFTFTIQAGIDPNAPTDAEVTINGFTTDSVGDADNVILNLGTHTGAPFVVKDLVIKSGTINLVNPLSFASEAGVLLRNSAFPGLAQVVRPVTTSPAGPIPYRVISAEFPTNGFAPDGYYLNLWGQTIPTGSTWTGELFEAFNDDQDLPEGEFVNFKLGLNGPSAGSYATGTAPTTFTDLGVIDSSTAPEATPLTSAQTAFGTIETRWFKFTLNSPTSYANFLDIYTTPGADLAGSEDTDIALFDANGRVRAVNDDGGEAFMSQLAIGGTIIPRAATTPTAGGSAGVIFNGLDALGTLAAGTYYLAVSPWDTDYDHGFVADTSLADPGAFAWTLNLRTNIAPGAGAATIAGSLNLLSTAGSGGTESIGWTLSNGVNTYNGTVSVADAGSSTYSIAIPGGAPNGAYTLKFKGGTFLSKTLNVSLTGSSLTGQNAALANGDIDQDGEVGPGDFEAVVAQFGGAGDADVDNDGEVGPSDFETIVANFGLGDE
jgi:hypothetical protein